MALDVSIMIEGQAGLNWENWAGLANAAEDLGYYGLFRSDHWIDFGGDKKDALEAWISLTWLASHTKRIAFGTLVSPISFRNPAVLAWQASGIDALAGGRLRLGVGAGWNEREHAAFGFPLGDLDTRFGRLEEGLQVILQLTRSADFTSFSGTHFSLDNAYLQPRSPLADGPPIVIGGNGPRRTLPLVAKYADEWNGVGLSLPDFQERSARLDVLLEGEGRTPDSLKRTLMTQALIGDSDAEIAARVGAEKVERARARGGLIGSPSELVDQLGRYHEGGVQGIQLQWWDASDLSEIELVAAEVLPQLR